MDILITILYIFVIAVNIYFQFAKKVSRDNKYNIFFFAVVFKLFAPKPFVTDLRIFYRDLLRDGTSTNLIEYNFYEKPSAKNFLWKFSNPKHLVIFTYITSIKQSHLKNPNGSDVIKSSIFLHIKSDIKKLNYSQDILTRQIIICSSKGYEDSKLTPTIISHIKY